MKYQNKQNGKVMEILKQDEKKGTMLIQFEDGKSTSITTGTFKRWYKKVEDNVATEIETPVNEPDKAVVDGVTDEEYVAEIMAQKKELGIECPEIKSVELVPMPGAERLAELKKEYSKNDVKEAKQKVSKAKAKKEKIPKQDVTESIQAVVAVVEKAGFQTKTYAGDIRTITVKNGAGKTVGDVHIGGSKCALSMRASLVPDGYVADRVRKCPNSHAFDIAYSDLNKLAELLNNIKEEN